MYAHLEPFEKENSIVREESCLYVASRGACFWQPSIRNETPSDTTKVVTFTLLLQSHVAPIG